LIKSNYNIIISVVMSFWLLTNAFGHAMVVFVVEVIHIRQTAEFLLFAVLMILFGFLFLFLIHKFDFEKQEAKEKLEKRMKQVQLASKVINSIRNLEQKEKKFTHRSNMAAKTLEFEAKWEESKKKIKEAKIKSLLGSNVYLDRLFDGYKTEKKYLKEEITKMKEEYFEQVKQAKEQNTKEDEEIDQLVRNLEVHGEKVETLQSWLVNFEDFEGWLNAKKSKEKELHTRLLALIKDTSKVQEDLFQVQLAWLQCKVELLSNTGDEMTSKKIALLNKKIEEMKQYHSKKIKSIESLTIELESMFNSSKESKILVDYTREDEKDDLLEDGITPNYGGVEKDEKGLQRGCKWRGIILLL
jgi:hypothetical protein